LPSLALGTLFSGDCRIRGASSTVMHFSVWEMEYCIVLCCQLSFAGGTLSVMSIPITCLIDICSLCSLTLGR
jgi:hypothetical protein